MKGLLVVLTGFVFLPGSVYMLLAANFGALKGYLIAATAFFGFLIMLSAVWLFGLVGQFHSAEAGMRYLALSMAMK